MEQTVKFFAANLALEARIERRDPKSGVVITHPHPLYGGDMDNPVVDAIRRVYVQCGFTTLRFNFRGVGGSQGRYDNGRGEQDDVKAAVALLVESGVARVDLAGYSFGAWINALSVTGGLQVQRLVMVSPPVALIAFDGVGALPALRLAVTGSLDDIAPADRLQPQLSRWNPAAALEIIDGCDHFYSGYTDQLRTILSRYLSDGETWQSVE